MNRKLLIVLFSLTMMVSYSAMADHRGGYHDGHYRGHQAKHHRHHHKHHGRFYRSHGKRGYKCRHRSHYRHGRYVGFYDGPRVALDINWGYPDRGAVLVYERYPRTGRGY